MTPSQDWENTNSKLGVPNPKTPDSRDIIAINRIPAGFTIYPTGAADNIANGTFGNGANLKMDGSSIGTSNKATFQMLNHWYGIGGRIIWESASIDDSIDGTLVAPASTGLVQATGDYTKLALGGSYNKIKPVAEGIGDWSADIAAKLTNTQILKCTPVPSSGGTGWFDYNSDTNVLTRNMNQLGNFDLYDFDVNLFKFANRIWGRKSDGAESSLESSNVVGKLLYNSWQVRFTLTCVTVGVRCAVIIQTAVKKNV